MTKTLATRPSIMTAAAVGLTTKERDQLGALALRETADRLRRRDPALVEDSVGLDPAVLRHREEHVEDLGGENVLRRVEQDRLDVCPTRLQVLLQFGPGGADVIGPPEGLHALIERAFGRSDRRFDWGG